MRWLVFLLAASSAAQVRVVYSPEPMAVSRTVGVDTIGPWAIRACNDGVAPVTLAEERFFMAAPQLRLLGADRAMQLLESAPPRRRIARAVQILGYLALAAGVIAAAKGVDPDVSSWLSVAGGLAPRVGDQIKAAAPSLAIFSGALLRGPISLAPRECATRLAFGARRPNVEPFEGTIQ